MSAGSAGARRRSPRPPAVPAAPLEPGQLLEAAIERSGLPGAPALRRAGPRLGIRTVRDLLFHLPRRYDDLRELRRLGDLGSVPDGTVVSARVRVAGLRVEQTWRRRVQRTTAQLEDGTGTAEATWFGRRFIERRLHEGDAVVISGRIRRRGWLVSFDGPEFQVDDGSALLHAGRIVPVYRLTAGLTAARLRVAVRAALDRAGNAYPEYLPDPLRSGDGLAPIGTALEEAHFPVTFAGRDAALRRLAFDELLALQLGMVERRRQRGESPTLAVDVDDATDRRIRKALSAALSRRLDRAVDLTADQGAAMDAIRSDLGRAVPMLRLLQGDVGSGKTAVAAYALAVVALAGRQGALLAPTDLLARQHLGTVGSLLEDLGLPVALLTGSLPADARRRALEAIASGQAAVAAAAVAAEAEHARLTGVLAPLRVGLVHGRLRPADRDREMARFRDGELDVLVGTTVVEVGVDVPEATVMIVEGAERFGLAQLHQLRGRVGRGTAESFCVLVSDVAEDSVGWARLRAVERIEDGFQLAEEDFALRGEGDVLGLAQSGLPRLRVASLQRADHRELAVRARAAAEDLLDERGRLRAGHEVLEAELTGGWLARVRSGEPGGGA